MAWVIVNNRSAVVLLLLLLFDRYFNHEYPPFARCTVGVVVVVVCVCRAEQRQAAIM